MTHPLAHADLTLDEALALLWQAYLDLERHTGIKAEVVALNNGVVPAHAPKVMTTNGTTAGP